MKNERIIAAWNQVEPDSAADERMLGAILVRNQSIGQSKKEKALTMKKNLSFKRLAPVAACLIVVVAITAIIGNNAGWFDEKVYTADLAGGTLNFHKNSVGAGSMAFVLGIDGTARDLTAEENDLLFGEAFGNYSVSSHGLFSIGDEYGPDKTLLHVEAMSLDNDGNHIDGMKIIIAASSLGCITDTMIETDRNDSEVNGVQVSAGYWITDKNSRGERNIIYLAAYETNDVSVYIEHGGSLERSDELRSEIAFAIDTLTRKGTPIISAITY